jgi:hypothetical protein
MPMIQTLSSNAPARRVDNSHLLGHSALAE